MYVVITSCTDPLLWYSDKIGERFLVRKVWDNPKEYEVTTKDKWSTVNFIRPEDCKEEE